MITPKNGSYPNTDATLLKDVPDELKVITTQTIEPFRLFNLLTGQAQRGKSSSVGMGDLKGKKTLIKRISGYIRANWFVPDARKGWVPFAVNAAAQQIEAGKIDAIVTTGPPHSTHLAGLELSKKFGVPWLADLRDPWTNIYYNQFLPRTASTTKKDQAYETEVIETAATVSVVSAGLEEEFRERAHSINVLPNGYDEEDFEGETKQEKNPVFELSYIGNYKDNQNCPALWKAIRELSNEHPAFQKSFRLSLTGNIHPSVSAALKSEHIEHFVELHPFVKHAEAIEKMKKASALLFLIPNSSDNKKIITGKIFEYLASRTPLFSIGPVDGDASHILKECNRHEMKAYDDHDGIKEQLFALFSEWENNHLKVHIEHNLHRRFSRRALTKQLSLYLDSIEHSHG